MTYKTPGVYVEEISLFPPSVAEVATAIPAFIGYTQKAVKDGEDLTNKPTRITSLLDYQQYFGGDCTPQTTVTIDKVKNAVDVAVTRLYMYESLRLFFDNGGGACYIVSVGDYSATPAAGNEADPVHSPGFKVGLKALEKYDEPTMIVMPDAVRLTPDSLHPLQGDALKQCNELGDRVAILDLPNQKLETAADTFRNLIGVNNLKYAATYAPWIVTAYDKTVPFEVVSGLKDKSGAAVTLDSLMSTGAEQKEVAQLVQKINDNAGSTPAPDKNAAEDEKTVKDGIETMSAPDSDLSTRYTALSMALAAIQLDPTASDKAADAQAKDADATTKLDDLFTFLRGIATGVVGWRTALKGPSLKKQVESAAASILRPAIDSIVAIEKNTEVEKILGRTDSDVEQDYNLFKGDLIGTWISNAPPDTKEDPKHYSNDAEGEPVSVLDQAKEISVDLKLIFDGLSKFVTTVLTAATVPAAPSTNLKADEIAQLKKTLVDTLYTRYPAIANIVRQIRLKLSEVPPSGAVSGVYAYVDATRGVWKAPANVSLNQVLTPVERIDDAAQQNLNVDVNSGKSINAIRSFTGRGTIVWGARTLAGNDNEWRYINVRRFFNMVEESVKKSTAWAVFEPNASPLWVKVKGMIENYLIQKWRDGALAGARPDDAFFVKVGLGQTMTAQDILEGRLNVEIGMAVVRPAEFIILKFSHLMQKS